MPREKTKPLDDPTMSDTTILVTVEDLIDRAMGPPDVNVVNFKLIQAILHILARQQRLLTQKVEIRIVELKRGKKKKSGYESSESSTESPLSLRDKAYKSPQRADIKEKDKAKEKERGEREGAATDKKAQVKSAKMQEGKTPFVTKQTHLMVAEEEEEEEEEAEEYVLKEKREQGKTKKVSQKEKEEKRKQEKTELISQKYKEKWESEEEKIQAIPEQGKKMEKREEYDTTGRTFQKKRYDVEEEIEKRKREWIFDKTRKKEIGKQKGYDAMPHKEKEKQERAEKISTQKGEVIDMYDNEEREEYWKTESKLQKKRHDVDEEIEKRKREWIFDKTRKKEKMMTETTETMPKAARQESQNEIEKQKDYSKIPQRDKLRSKEDETKDYEKLLEKEKGRREKADKMPPEPGETMEEYDNEEQEEIQKPEKGSHKWRSEDETDHETPHKEKSRFRKDEREERKGYQKYSQKIPPKKGETLVEYDSEEREEFWKTERKRTEMAPKKGIQELEEDKIEEQMEYVKVPLREKERPKKEEREKRDKYEKVPQEEDMTEEKEREERKEYEKLPEKGKKIPEKDEKMFLQDEIMEMSEKNGKKTLEEGEIRKKFDNTEKTSPKERYKSKEDAVEKQKEYEKLPQEEKERRRQTEEHKKDHEKKYEKAEKTEKIDRTEQKEIDEAYRMTAKEKEKFDREEKKGHKKVENMTPREIERFEKEEKKEDKADKLTPKEKERIEIKEKEKAEKISKKLKGKSEREEMKDEQSEKEKTIQKSVKERLPPKEQKSDRKKPAPGSGIDVTEKIVDNEKILVVKKGPARHDSKSSSSIEVVTRSQFGLLEAAVQQLRRAAAPLPLQLPDNRQLMSDVVSGAATLPDAMEALQLEGRLRATEEALVRMAGLLTQLAAAGSLPDDIAMQLEKIQTAYEGGLPQELADQLQQAKEAVQADKSRQLGTKKSVAIDPRTGSKISKGIEMASYEGEPLTAIMSVVSQPSTTSRVSRVSSMAARRGVPCVTYDEMKAALKDLREELMKYLDNKSGRATNSAENALYVAKLVAEKLNIALKLDDRLSLLQSVVGDYTEQLNGFNSGVTTQIQSFQDQMEQMRIDLQAGLVQLENVNNNAETAAVMELRERFGELASELDSTLHTHKALTTLQSELSAEMRGLVECVEMLREEKADRDEVLDGLRDKADTSKLAGLLTEAEFADARVDFERRIDLCYDKFSRQDAVWQRVIRDLKNVTDKKAELVELLSARDDAQRQLQELNHKIAMLATVLGEPKAALLTRKLAEGATCGACHERALMEAREPAHGAPHRLPALRPPPLGAAQEPCIADWSLEGPAVDRHMCHRWCGGSHTLVAESTRRAVAVPTDVHLATRKFVDYGDDGRLYMMEEECQPCIECNLPPEEETPPPPLGAGDMAPQPEPSLECTCPLTK